MAKIDTSFSSDFWVGMATPFILALWIIPAILLRAWIITMLWAWYIVPGFGLQPLRMSIAFGLSVIVAMMAANRGKDDRSPGHIIAATFIGPLLSLLIGWIGSFFV